MHRIRVRVAAVVSAAVVAVSSVAIGVAPTAQAAGPTTLAGVVTDAVAGTAIAGAQVDVVLGSSFEPGAVVVASATTDANGAYSILLAGLATAADRVTVDVTDQNEMYGASYANAVTLVDDDTVAAPFALTPGASVSGTVTAGGAAIAGSCVTVRNQATALVVPPGGPGSCTDVTGQYSLPTLGAGTYTLTFSSPDTTQWSSIAARQITVIAGEPLTANATLAPVGVTSITGTVTEVGSGTALAGIDVTAATTDADGAAQTLTATTDAAGAFTLPITFAIGPNPFVIDASDPTGAHHPATGITISVQNGYTEAVGITLQPSDVAPTVDVSISAPFFTDVIVGQPTTIPFTVRNAGPTAAADVATEITVPVNLTIDGVEAPAGFTCSVSEQTINCAAPTLGVQRDAVIGVRLLAPFQSFSSFLILSARVTTSSIDRSTTDDSTFAATIAQPDQADVAAFVDTTPLQVGVSSPISFGITSSGRATAPDVFATLDLPAGLAIDRVESPGWSCAIDGQTVGCSAPTLAPEGSLSTKVFVTASSLAAALPLRAGAGTTKFDPNLINNVANATIDVVPVGSVDLSLSGAGFFFSPVVNRPAQFSFNAFNFGPATAVDPQVDITFPRDVDLDSVSVMPAGALECGSEAGIVRCAAGSLAPFTNVQITVALVPRVAGAELTVSGNISSASPDLGRYANDAVVGPYVVAAEAADLTIDLFPDSVPRIGVPMSVLVVVFNRSALEAVGVETVVTVPDGFAIDSVSTGASVQCTVDGQVIRCTAPSARAFADTVIARIWVVAAAPASGDLLATVTAATPDPQPANNSRGINLTAVAPIADLDIVAFEPPAISVGQPAMLSVATNNFGPAVATDATLTIDVPAPFTPVDATGFGWSCSVLDHTVSCVASAVFPGTFGSVGVRVRADAPGDAIATATIASSLPDPDTSNNVSTTSLVAIEASADLDVRVFGPAGTLVGQPFTLTTTMTNNGPSIAEAVTVTVDVPAPLRVVSGPGFGSACTVTDHTVVCNVSDVSAFFTTGFTVTLVADQAGSWPVTASATSPTADPITGNDSFTATVVATAPAADVSIFLNGPGQVVPGEAVEVVAGLSNFSFQGVPAAQVEASFTVTGGRITATSSQLFACVVDAASARCAADRLGAFAFDSIVLTIVPDEAASVLSVRATVTTASNDPNPFNDSSSFSAPVSPQGTADLAAQFLGTGSTYTVGRSTDIRIGATNFGPSTIGAMVTLMVPSELEVVGVVEDAGVTCAPAPGGLRCATSPLSPFQNAGATVTLRGVAPAPSGATVTVNVSGATSDPNPFNDVFEQFAFVVADEADLSVFIAGLDSVAVGDTTSVAVQAINRGPVVARDATVDITIPEGLSLVNAFGPCSEIEAGLVRCSFADIEVNTGPFASLILLATDATGLVSITATISGSQVDPVPDDQTTSWPIRVVPAGSVDVAVGVGPTQLVVGVPDNLAVTMANVSPGGILATDVRVSATYSDELRIDGATPLDGGDCTVQGQTVECLLPTLFASGTILVAVTPLATTTDATVTATISSPGFDPNLADNESTATIEIIPDEADIALVGGGEPAPITVGQNAFGSLFVQSQGVATPRNASVRLEPGPGLEIIAGSVLFGDFCTPDGSAWICPLPVMPPGSDTVISYVMVGTAAGTGAEVRHIATADNDIDPSNDEFSILLDVYPEGASNLGVQLLANRVDDLGTTEVFVDVDPGGPAPEARDVTLHLSLPGLSAGPISVTDLFGNPVGNCVAGNEEVTCTFDSIAVFDRRSLQFTATPVRSVTGARIVASVSSPFFDPDQTFNTASSEPYDIALVPYQPARPVGTPRDRAVDLGWGYGGAFPGPPLNDFIVEYSTDGGATWTRYADEGPSEDPAIGITVTGLRNGVAYVFRVAGANQFGIGPWSEVSAPVTPSLPPRAPERLDADGGRRQVFLDWRAPSQRGRNPIIDYVIQYSTDRGRTWTTYDDGVSTRTSATVTGLANNTRYTFRVAAVNDAGQGAFSETETATTSRR